MTRRGHIYELKIDNKVLLFHSQQRQQKHINKKNHIDVGVFIDICTTDANIGII